MHRPERNAMQGMGSGAYDPGVNFLVLGPIEVQDNGDSLPVGGPKQRSILALLVANAGRPVSMDRIVDGIYGDEAADGARHSVQTYVSTIRRDLGDIVRKDAGGYVLTIDAERIDAVRFEESVRSAIPLIEEDPDTASALLRDALAMWRGHAYADVDGWGVFEPEITRLSELRLSALEARIDADLALGRHRELLGELDALTIEHPLRERFRAQQMLALYRCGRQTEALRAYERTRTYLADEIGIDASPELRTLEQRILDHDPELDLPAAPSLTERAVVVVEVADTTTLARLDPRERANLVETTAAAFAAATDRHNGAGSTQRGSALYAGFPSMADAIEVVSEITASASSPRLRVAIDYGDVEIHDSGETSGPPVRRSAGMVAAAHPGQVLLSAGAHEALLATSESGWTVRSLGLHPIHGIDAPQQVFQFILEGEDREFPPLLRDTAPPPLPMDRGAVAGYELRRPISTDLSGTTYRAYQPSVGREVVITVIDAAWANEPEFISAFEVETQLVTRLQHPHIVPVLDYWRDPTGAYLVAPSFGGKSLPQALHSADLADDQRRTIIAQLGAALSAAHHLGVVHGAISPDSVMLDEEGNAYLTAAGFVLRIAGAPRVPSPHTPPESQRGGPITVASDVYSLGVLAGELLGDGASTVVETATSLRPDDRYRSVDEFLAQLATVAGATGPTGTFTETRNPYKGLDAFTEADAGDFFGRSDTVTALAGMLSEHHLVGVVGPSGSGKSSLVRAGLIPAVRAGAVDGSRRWLITGMFPGSYPFVELESALARVAVEDPGKVLAELAQDEHGLVRAIKRILPTDTRLLLVVDQFEELFTLTRDDETRERFLRALVALAEDARSEVRVVITLRADFFDRPLQYSVFGELLIAGTFALATPAPAQLAEAIRRPAEGVGVTWEAGLVDQIVADVADEPGTLPLLQYALTEVFAARATDELTHDGYRTAGGVLGALGTRADEVFNALDHRRQVVTRQVFLRLVAVQASGEQTRRRARLIDLNAIAEPGDVTAVLSAFGDARLVTFDRDPVTRGPTVEVAHEALLTRWQHLAGWIVEAREDLVLHQRLADAASEWDQRQRDPGYLLSGGRLAQFQAWSDTTEFNLTAGEAEYLARSSRRAAEERARRRRIRNFVVAGLSVAVVVATVFGLLALLNSRDASANAGLAHSRELTASAIAVLDQDPELSLLLALESANVSDPTIESLSAVHESLAAHHKILTYEWPPDQPLPQDLSTRISPNGHLLVASGGGTYIEVVDIDRGEVVWSRDFGGRGITRATFTHDGSAVVVTYGWSSTAGLSTTMDADTHAALGVHLLEAGSGDQIRHFPIGVCGVVTQQLSMTAVGSGSDSFLVTELDDNPNCVFNGSRVEITNPQDLRRPHTFLIDLSSGGFEQLSTEKPDANDSPQVQVSRDAGTLLIGEWLFEERRSTARVVDRYSGEDIAVVEGWPADAGADGSIVLTYGDGGTLVWDIGQPEEPLAAIDAGPAVMDPRDSVVVSPSGSNLSLWDPATGAAAGEIITGLGSIDRQTFSGDGSRLLVNEVFGTTAVAFDFDAPRELASVELCSRFDFLGLVDVAGETTTVRGVCPENRLITQFFIDPETLAVTGTIAPSGGFRSALSRDGTLLADQFEDFSEFQNDVVQGRIRLYETEAGTLRADLEGMCEHTFDDRTGCVPYPGTPYADWVRNMDFSPDGSLLAVAGDNSDGVSVYDVEAERLMATATVEHKTRQHYRGGDVVFSPDGSRLAASFHDSPVELWLLSTDDWTSIAEYLPSSESTGEVPSLNLLFTPDGQTLIAADVPDVSEGRIVFMDGQTLEHLGDIPNAHAGGVEQLALSPDGTLLASAGLDGFVRVWEVATRSLVHQVPMTSDGSTVGGVGFMPDGRRLSVTTPATGEVHLVTIDTDELLEIARTRVTRSFTETECTTYRIDPCPTLDEIRGG